MSHLHILALNHPSDTRHTHLTRAKGEGADLPPLADWLGVNSLDTDVIELFPVKDLDDMPLSDYVTTAFAPEAAIPAETRARMDALDGSVLLVPGGALPPSAPTPGPDVTLIASIQLAEPDHSADLPPADVTPTKHAAAPDTPPEQRSGSSFYVIVTIAMVIVLFLAFAL